MISESLLDKLKECFPNSFINRHNEFIGLYEYKDHIVNSWFRLDNVASELELKCKVLEYFSRPSFKGFTFADQPLRERQVGEEVYKYHLDGINKFLGVGFTTNQIEEIYCRLGNGVNRPLCIKFIESDYDLRVLKEQNNETN